MSSYRVVATREGEWWALSIDGPGLKRPQNTQVRRLEQAEAMARDLIALLLDKDDADVGAIEVTLADDEVAEEVADTHKTRAEADRLRVEAAAKTRKIALKLAKRGYVQRDIGHLLGMSHQAIGKLLGDKMTDRVVEKRDVKGRTGV